MYKRPGTPNWKDSLIRVQRTGKYRNYHLQTDSSSALSEDWMQGLLSEVEVRVTQLHITCRPVVIPVFFWVEFQHFGQEDRRQGAADGCAREQRLVQVFVYFFGWLDCEAFFLRRLLLAAFAAPLPSSPFPPRLVDPLSPAPPKCASCALSANKHDSSVFCNILKGIRL